MRIAEGYMIDENGNDSGSLKENKDNNNRGMLTRSKSAQQNAESTVSSGSNRGTQKGGIKPTRAQMLRNAQIEKVNECQISRLIHVDDGYWGRNLLMGLRRVGDGFHPFCQQSLTLAPDRLLTKILPPTSSCQHSIVGNIALLTTYVIFF